MGAQSCTDAVLSAAATTSAAALGSSRWLMAPAMKESGKMTRHPGKHQGVLQVYRVDTSINYCRLASTGWSVVVVHMAWN
jgi:hypothetical protein